MPVLPEVGSMMTEPGFQLAGGLRVVDHLLCDAVLDGTCGVKILKLGQNFGLEVQFLFNVREFKQWSLANQLVSGRVNVRHIQNLLYDVIKMKASIWFLCHISTRHRNAAREKTICCICGLISLELK